MARQKVRIEYSVAVVFELLNWVIFCVCGRSRGKLQYE